MPLDGLTGRIRNVNYFSKVFITNPERSDAGAARGRRGAWATVGVRAVGGQFPSAACRAARGLRKNRLRRDKVHTMLTDKFDGSGLPNRNNYNTPIRRSPDPSTGRAGGLESLPPRKDFTSSNVIRHSGATESDVKNLVTRDSTSNRFRLAE